MRTLAILWRPRLLSFRNGRLSRTARDRRARLYLFSLVGFVFWLGTYGVFHRVLTYFQGVEGFGDILAARLLAMTIMTFFSLLVFSHVVTVLGKIYLSRDLDLVHSLPVPPGEIFLARWGESVVDGSWMVVLFGFPVFLAYGVIYKAQVSFYVVTLLAVAAMCLAASGIGALVVVALAVALPAGRIRNAVVVLGVLLLLVLVVVVRVLRPEQLVNPEYFLSVAFYLRSMEAVGSPFLPTTWVYDAVHGALTGDLGDALFNTALTGSLALSLAFVNFWVASVLYFPGFSRAQTTSLRLFAPLRRGEGRFPPIPFLPRPLRAFVVKEIRTFFRDSSQWSQIFLILGLVVIYLYNFSVLPLDKTPIRTVYLQNLFSFLNMGLAAFVTTAVAARFCFPAVSMEGTAFWIVRASPVSLEALLWIKFLVYLVPLLLLTEVLVVVTNILLGVTPFMMALSAGTILFMVPGVVAMAVGLGAAYPDFASENPAQSVTSFGGLLYMMLSAAFIALVAVVEAGPVYSLFMTTVRGLEPSWVEILGLTASLALVVVLCALAVVLPLRLGARRLEDV